MRDEGVSAFKGEHRAERHADTHALAEFLAAVKSGRVPVGSFLVLESLDRLTREDIVTAVNLFTSILLAGINIVQLHPNEHVYTKGADMTHVMLALVELSRGNSESRMKSERVGRAWREKQKNAASKIVTKKLPGWIVEKKGKLFLDQKKAAVVRRIFALSLDGYGARAIAETLNAEEVPVLGRVKIKGNAVKWGNTTVYYILKSRATVGEYAPYKDSSGRSTREAIKDYFPAVVDEPTFQAAQGGIHLRAKVGRGRRGKHVNLFAGLLKTVDGGLTYWHNGTRPPVLVPVSAINGKGGKWTSFPADPFDRAVLSELAEVKAAEIVACGDANRVEVLSGRVVEVDGLIQGWSAKMNDPTIIDIVAAKLSELNTEKKALTEALAGARRGAASPVSETWGEFKTLVGLLESDTSDEMRMKIRRALRRAIESVDCMFVDVDAKRVAVVRVQFVGTEKHRYYFLTHQRRKPLVVQSRLWIQTSIDIRTRDGCEAMERLVRGRAPSA